MVHGNTGRKFSKDVKLRMRKSFLLRTQTEEYTQFLKRKQEENRKPLEQHLNNTTNKIQGKNIKIRRLEREGKRVIGYFKCKKCKTKWSSRIDSNIGCTPCRSENNRRLRTKPVADLLRNDKKYSQFRKQVARLTGQIYRQYYENINPKGKSRTYYGHHLDHIHSISAAYKSEAKNPPKIQEIAHPCNLRMLKGYKNINKNANCAITITELRQKIRKWNKKHGNPFVKKNGLILLRRLLP